MSGDTSVLGSATTNTTRGSVAEAKADVREELLLFDPANEQVLVVPREHSVAFLQEANKMQTWVIKLVEAKEKLLTLEANLETEEAKRFPSLGEVQRLKTQIAQARKQYDAAYAEVDKELGKQGYLTGAGDGKEILELVPLAKRRGAGRATDWNGRKWTYVRSEKVKNHWRSYKLGSKDAAQAKSFVRGGKIDTKALGQQFGKLEPKFKAEWNVYTAGYVFPNLQAWAEVLNAKSDASKPVQFSRGVHLFRCFAGCGAAAEWNPRGGKIAGKLNGKAELMLAQGECSASGFLPSPDGWAWVITGMKSGTPFHIGHMRFAAEAKLFAAAGASVAAELSLEVDYSQLTKASVKGARRPKGQPAAAKNVSLADMGAGASAGAEAFAGVRAGGEFKGGLQFKNPEKNDEMDYIAAIGPKVEGQWGAGAAASFIIHFEDGKFKLRAKAGLCLGLGAKGEIGLEVDAKRLSSFLYYLFHALLNANFEMVQVVTETAYTAATQVQVMLVSGVSDAYTNVRGKWTEFSRQLDREDHRIHLMERVLSNPSELRVSTPEAHGILLYQLTRHGALTKLKPENTGWNLEWMAERKKAVVQVCRWAQTRRQFENIVQHIHPEGRRGSFRGNFDGLLRFLEIGPLNSSYDDDLRAMYHRLPDRPASGYAVAQNNTSAFTAQAMIGPKAEYLAALQNPATGTISLA